MLLDIPTLYSILLRCCIQRAERKPEKQELNQWLEKGNIWNSMITFCLNAKTPGDHCSLIYSFLKNKTKLVRA